MKEGIRIVRDAVEKRLHTLIDMVIYRKKNGKMIRGTTMVKEIYKHSHVYEGEWKDDKRHGTAKYTFANGNVKNGEFENGDFKKWL